jgi:hypothetical protein
MKVELMKHYERPTCWAIGVHFFSLRVGTFVALIGTSRQFGFKRGATSFGLCLGPITIGGAR